MTGSARGLRRRRWGLWMLWVGIALAVFALASPSVFALAGWPYWGGLGIATGAAAGVGIVNGVRLMRSANDDKTPPTA